jgi:hypothetical protein
MRSRRLLTRRTASAQVTPVAVDTPGVVLAAVAILGEGVAILGAEAAGREAGWAGWDVEAWADGEDKAIAGEAP